MTNELFQNQNIALLGFDLVFAEADGSSDLQQLQKLAEKEFSTDVLFLKQYKSLEPTLDFDAQFAQSLRHKKVVLSYYFTSDSQARISGSLPSPVIAQKVYKAHLFAPLSGMGLAPIFKKHRFSE